MYVGLRRGGLGALPLCADSCPPDAQWVPCLKIPLLALQVKRVRCESSGVLVPKDKAIKRFIVRNMVDASAIRDLQEACTIDSEYLGYGKGVAGARRWRAPARQERVRRPLLCCRTPRMLRLTPRTPPSLHSICRLRSPQDLQVCSRSGVGAGRPTGLEFAVCCVIIPWCSFAPSLPCHHAGKCTTASLRPSTPRSCACGP